MATATSVSIANVLNDLLASETGGWIPHLHTNTVFISWASAAQVEQIRAMIRDEREHERWLVDAILGEDGYPKPAKPDVMLAGLHYLELHALLPLVLKEKRNLIRRYEEAAGALSARPRAAELAARILERHRRHLLELETMVSDSASKPNPKHP